MDYIHYQEMRQLEEVSAYKMKGMLCQSDLGLFRAGINKEEACFSQEGAQNQLLNEQSSLENKRLKKFIYQQQQNREMLAKQEEYLSANQLQSNISQPNAINSGKFQGIQYQNIEGELCEKEVLSKIFCGTSTDNQHYQQNSNLDYDRYDQQQKNCFYTNNENEIVNGQKEIKSGYENQEIKQFQKITSIDVKTNLTDLKKNIQKTQGYFYSLNSQIQPSLKPSFFQGAPANQQIQKQYLPKQVKESYIQNFDVSPRANLNNQLKEKVFENINKPTEFETKLEKEVMMGKINNHIYCSPDNNENFYYMSDQSQTCNLPENLEGESYQNYQFQQPNTVLSSYRVDGGIDHLAYNFSKRQENYQVVNEIYQKDEYLIYGSDKLQPYNQTQICEDLENLVNPYENDPNIFENQYGQQQLYQLDREEQLFIDQLAQISHHSMENQGDLYFQQFSTQQNYNYPQSYQQQKINQNSQIEDQVYQEQYQPQQIQSINNSCDGSYFLKQQLALNHNIAKNESSSKIENTETQDNANLESCSSLENSRNSKSSSVTNQHDLEYLTYNQNNSKNSIDQNQDTKSQSQQSEDIVDQVIHLNKKNIVRNIIRAFKKYFLNKKAKPQAALQFFPEQSLEASRNQFKQYFANKKFNNSILKQLIVHPKYGEIFNFFLLNKSNEYLDHSNIKTKKSHELFINYLVLCYNDPQKLTYLETYSKL
ncbi:hypothetical protein TTHERM_00566870 (macronuclear) [Tetrahymena thermophila SB210]|uniref:Uncharacterized protein n=1 Tax=Tetrahymena thermophila (strain SB210) TaxID=312017 RepID=I7MGR0_TETTS|nr:hypothetical protein TTHERM_00566870 [Tetrahymena thermophila SB210]EAS01843.2 hypothetical protein TTHERM_00566870 [Tetrahymena thermophila SB210]|eukprot:XP_001022088.2 hypothetical protein TTHERM_00566870 [Tetrahymena thermophila SB210]